MGRLRLRSVLAACVLLGTWLVVGLPWAGAQPSGPDAGNGLYFTSTKVSGALPIDDYHYELASEPGSAGTVPLGWFAYYYATDVHFEQTVEGTFTYLGPVELKVPVRCTAAWTGIAGFTVSLYVDDVRLGSVIPAFPQSCVAGAIVDGTATWDLTYLRLEDGDALRVVFGPSLANPPPSLLELVTGDPDHPAGLFGEWTDQELFVPWSLSHDWECCSFSQVSYWATGAEAATLHVSGEVAGTSASYYIQIAITSVSEPGLELTKRYEAQGGSRDFEDDSVIDMASGSGIRIAVTSFADDGSRLEVALVPVQLEVTETVEDLPPPGPANATQPVPGSQADGPAPPIEGSQPGTGDGTPLPGERLDAQEAPALPLGILCTAPLLVAAWARRRA